MKKFFLAVVVVLVTLGTGLFISGKLHIPHRYGDTIDSLNHVKVYFNGAVSHSGDRNIAADGYNLGIKYQCVEFVKRYYYERFNHKMPNSFGHAKDFYDPTVEDGTLNTDRGLLQFSNPGNQPPQPDDLIVFGPTRFNQYGHVAIVASVGKNKIEIIQQNAGYFGSSRDILATEVQNGKWRIKNKRVKGWLRKP